MTHEIRLKQSVPIRPFSESSVFYASKDGIKDGDGGKVNVFFDVAYNILYIKSGYFIQISLCGYCFAPFLFEEICG